MFLWLMICGWCAGAVWYDFMEGSPCKGFCSCWAVMSPNGYKYCFHLSMPMFMDSHLAFCLSSSRSCSACATVSFETYCLNSGKRCYICFNLFVMLSKSSPSKFSVIPYCSKGKELSFFVNFFYLSLHLLQLWVFELSRARDPPLSSCTLQL